MRGIDSGSDSNPLRARIMRASSVSLSAHLVVHSILLSLPAIDRRDVKGELTDR